MKRAALGCGCLLVPVLLLVTLPLLILNSASASGAPIGNVAPPGSAKPEPIAFGPLFPWTPAKGEPILAGYPEGQCTWFVSWEGHDGGDHRVTWGGDGGDWYANAAAAGVPVEPASVTPQVGWIAVYARGHGSSEWGHVAVVVAVSGTGYTIAEMNVLGLGVADERTLPFGTSAPLLEGWIP